MDAGPSRTKVAIIGLGNIGKAVATNLTKGGHAVVLAAREPSGARSFADTLGSNATAGEITTAIADADVVIPAIPFEGVKDFLKTYTRELAGKIIVDVSNPIVPDGNGGFKKIIGQGSQLAGYYLNSPPSMRYW